MKFVVPALLAFACLAGVALAGACPEDAAPCCCKPVKKYVLVEAPSCAGAKESCAGSKDSCSGRTTFAQRRAARQTSRQEARAARAASRSCCGEAPQVVVVAAPQCPQDAGCCPSQCGCR